MSITDRHGTRPGRYKNSTFIDALPIDFFFQAEDGIRDYKVTGVQTCALPISSPTGSGHNRSRSEEEGFHQSVSAESGQHSPPIEQMAYQRPSLGNDGYWHNAQIGRASCRERV